MALQKPNLLFKSRLKYDLGKLIPFNNESKQYDILLSAYCTYIQRLEVAGTKRITFEVYRPDLLSFEIYNDVKYKIPLMIYNDMYDFRDFLPGKIISYPSSIDFDTLLFKLGNN